MLTARPTNSSSALDAIALFFNFSTDLLAEVKKDCRACRLSCLAARNCAKTSILPIEVLTLSVSWGVQFPPSAFQLEIVPSGIIVFWKITSLRIALLRLAPLRFA